MSNLSEEDVSDSEVNRPIPLAPPTYITRFHRIVLVSLANLYDRASTRMAVGGQLNWRISVSERGAYQVMEQGIFQSLSNVLNRSQRNTPRELNPWAEWFVNAYDEVVVLLPDLEVGGEIRLVIAPVTTRALLQLIRDLPEPAAAAARSRRSSARMALQSAKKKMTSMPVGSMIRVNLAHLYTLL
ncbi:hypothetical protein QFC24_006755 [Naganishia onofrii]|uniref:Uncharacterized protein n=1 Tax=Naganishia onofrii TaxID=1851511 RepID=A0ACC2X191_9TREE|nr:hypothetical protein QFC24_006755 [Naganishia onofrii]